MTTYTEETKGMMRKFFQTLTEKDKRRYAAVEAQKLGHGGVSSIANILGCARSTISMGMSELEALTAETKETNRIRRPGGGRKSYEETITGIDEAFWSVLEDDIAGDPMDETVRWTHLTPREIKQGLAEQQDIEVSETVVRQLLSKHNFRRRKAQKKAP